VTIDAIQFVAPGITVNNFGQGNDFNIRGIGKAEHNSQTTTGVIVYRDGIATFPGYFQEEPYYDIASVEILRARRAPSWPERHRRRGVHHHQQPGHQRRRARLHRRSARQLRRRRHPGRDQPADQRHPGARVSFNAEGRNSFYTVTGPNHGNPGNIREGSFRLGLLWKPTDALTVLFKTDYNYLDMGAYPADPYYDTNNPFKLTANFPASAVDKFVRSDLKIDYVMPNGITLRSISGYQKGNTEYHTDLDGTDNAVSGLAVQTFGDSVDETIYSEELNLISRAPGRSPGSSAATISPTSIISFRASSSSASRLAATRCKAPILRRPPPASARSATTCRRVSRSRLAPGIPASRLPTTSRSTSMDFRLSTNSRPSRTTSPARWR